MDPSQGMAEMTAASAAGEMNQEGIRGIVMEGNCNRRRWLAHGNICRCSCRGENHSAMRPGSLRLRSPSEGRELPTIVAVGQVQDKVLGMARRMGQGDEPLP